MTTFNPTSDFAAVADGLEQATLHRRGAPAGEPGMSVAHALRRAMSAREAAQSGGRYTASDVVWHLPVEELAVAPAVGDVLADAAGRRFTIVDLELATLGVRWRCTTRELTVAGTLDDTVTILKATYAKGPSGAAEATWAPWKMGVRACIQPAATREAAGQPALETTTQFVIYLAEDLALDHTHRIQGPDGAVYRIVRTSGAGRLGELQTIEAEKLS